VLLQTLLRFFSDSGLLICRGFIMFSRVFIVFFVGVGRHTAISSVHVYGVLVYT